MTANFPPPPLGRLTVASIGVPIEAAASAVAEAVLAEALAPARASIDTALATIGAPARAALATVHAACAVPPSVALTALDMRAVPLAHQTFASALLPALAALRLVRWPGRAAVPRRPPLCLLPQPPDEGESADAD